MNLKSAISKTILGILTLLIISILATYLFFRSEIDQMLGGNTEVVDISQFKPVTGLLAITNVNVLSTDSQKMRPNQTVLIKDNKIESVGERSAIPTNYQVIDGSGRYLIPGLIDSHVHVKKSKNDLLLYIANGVTQIGEMTGMAHHFEYRNEINHGAIGPQMFIASPKVTSQEGMKIKFRSQFEKRHQNFLTADEGRHAVRKFKTMGYEAIKLSSHLKADIYYAINEEAKKLGLPVIGHLPVGLQLKDLYQSGQSQLAHIDSIIHHLMNEFGGLSAGNSQDFLHHINRLADPIAKKLKQNNIALASTIWLHQTRPKQDFDLTSFLKSIEIEYQNPGWLEGSKASRGCLPGSNSYENPHNTDAESMRASATYYQTYNQAIKVMTQALVRHGVTITAGTDSLGACGMIAGFSLHNELTTLHQYGLTPAQVLQTATLSAAKWMGVKTGKIATGYRADLVMLDHNPLDDITNTRSINAVVANGNYWDRTQLDKMLMAVKEANNRSRSINIEKFLN